MLEKGWLVAIAKSELDCWKWRNGEPRTQRMLMSWMKKKQEKLKQQTELKKSMPMKQATGQHQPESKECPGVVDTVV